MVIKLAPGLVDEMAQFLSETLPETLRAEENIWSDGLTLPAPNAIVKRDPDDPRRMNNPPYLYVVVSRSQVFDWNRDNVLAGHQLVLWLVAQNSDVELLRKLVYRYGNALWKSLIKADKELTYRMALPNSNVMPEIDYGETLTRGNVAMGDVRLITWWSKGEQ